MLKHLVIIIMLLFCLTKLIAQVNIIFDTDIGGDADDLGALVMLHNFIDKGECNLLAVMCWSTEEYAVSAIDAINRFYNHPDIPVGSRKNEIHFDDWNYTKPIADHFRHSLNYSNVPDATLLYRRTLTNSPDKSIKIISVGPLKNIENLINSKPDSISELDGKSLLKQKVNEFVIMGGQFPEGEREWNFNGDMPGVTKYVIPNIPVPITFSGFEIGRAIQTGEIFNKIDPNTPLYVGFMHFSKNAPWIKDYFKGKILDNSTFDQTAVLYAVRNGVGTYWDKVTNGICIPDENGGNKWIEKKGSNHSYLKLIMDNEEIATIIESIMLNKF